MSVPISFGYHIQPEGLDDPNRSTPPAELYRHLARLKHRSGGHLVLNILDHAIQVAKAQPNHVVFMRYHSMRGITDGKMHLKGGIPAAEWVATVEKDWNKAKAAGVTNIAFVTLNEPGTGSAQQIVDWHTNIDQNGTPIPNKDEGVMDMCAKKRIPLSVMQLGISDWELNELEILLPVFRKISQHDDLFALSLHEYFGIVADSGMPLLGNKDPEFVILDGAWSSPDAKKAWLAAGQPYFAIQPENWPVRTDERKYHVGRHQDVIDICEKNGIPRPVIDITEAGADDMNEGGQGFVGAWFKSIKISEGFKNPRFWRSLTDQWAAWYGKRGWSAQRTYWEMLKWLLLHVWMTLYKGKSRRIRSIIIFNWWSSGIIGSAEDWNPSRVDNAYEFQGEHEKWANAEPIPPTPPPPPAPEPTPIPTPVPITTAPPYSSGKYYVTAAHTLGQIANVYADKITTSKVIGTFQAWQDRPKSVEVVFISTKENNALMPFIHGSLHGWVLKSDIILEHDEPPIVVSPADTRFTPGIVKLTANRLGIARAKPRLDATMVGSLRNTNQIDFIRFNDLTPLEQTYVTRPDGIWIVIRIGQTVAFVDGDTVALTEVAPPAPAPVVEAIVVVHPTLGFNVRTEPIGTTNANIVGKISPGQHVRILERIKGEDGSEWLRIERPPSGSVAGVAGWVSSIFGKVIFVETLAGDAELRAALDAERQSHAQTQALLDQKNQGVDAAEMEARAIIHEIAQVGLNLMNVVSDQVTPTVQKVDALLKSLEKV